MILHKFNKIHIYPTLKHLKYRLESNIFNNVHQADALLMHLKIEALEIHWVSLFSSLTKYSVFSNQLQLFLV